MNEMHLQYNTAANLYYVSSEHYDAHYYNCVFHGSVEQIRQYINSQPVFQAEFYDAPLGRTWTETRWFGDGPWGQHWVIGSEKEVTETVASVVGESHSFTKEIEIDGKTFILSDDNDAKVIEVSLPHQCDEWLIGDTDAVKQFIKALQEVVKLLANT